MLRAGLTMFAASALLALLPSVAQRMSGRPVTYGVLLGCFGAGAVLGALTMEPARRRWSLEIVATAAVGLLGAMIIAAGAARSIAPLAGVMLLAGGGWIVFISLISALVQNLTPDWARARVLAVFMLIFEGGLAIGSALWGAVATRTSLSAAFALSGVATIATMLFAAIAKLPDTTADLTPWNHWRKPAITAADALALERGEVLVTVRYRVDAEHAAAFLRAMQRYERVRRRDGAFWWGIFRDLEEPGTYLETLVVTSWAEHLRQHERFTEADHAVAAQVRRHVLDEPVVRHLIQADAEP